MVGLDSIYRRGVEIGPGASIGITMLCDGRVPLLIQTYSAIVNVSVIIKIRIQEIALMIKIDFLFRMGEAGEEKGYKYDDRDIPGDAGDETVKMGLA